MDNTLVDHGNDKRHESSAAGIIRLRNTRAYLPLGFLIVRLLLGSLLLAGAVLKGHQFLTGVSVDTYVGVLPIWFRQWLTPAELLLGLWFISGVWLTAASITVLIAFACFTSYSLLLLLRGDGQCGCFGSAAISPWAAFAIDLLAINLILLVPRTNGKELKYIDGLFLLPRLSRCWYVKVVQISIIAALFCFTIAWSAHNIAYDSRLHGTINQQIDSDSAHCQMHCRTLVENLLQPIDFSRLCLKRLSEH